MELSPFSPDAFADLDRLHRQIQQVFDASPDIRGYSRGGFPALNVGRTDDSAEIFAFAAGLAPESIEVTLEQGVLSIAGQRESDSPGNAKASIHKSERFRGRFHRVLTLSDDLDPASVQARYRDGLLHISIKRLASSQPRRIAID
jgi:HSP20 family protein